MSEKAYILNIYNTMTGEFELVQVTKEVFLFASGVTNRQMSGVHSRK